MTRNELIARILEGDIAGTQGTDFGLGISGQEFSFQNWVGDNFNKRRKDKFKRPPLHEMEDKWLSMKSHITTSALKKDMGGRRLKAYVYGAMRKRGWKPSRERVNETMDSIARTSKRTVGKIKKQFKREVIRPVRGVMAASRYSKKAGREIARGNVGRGLEMHRRAKAVMKAHAPVVASSAVGLVGGALSLPIPGGAEFGAVASAKVAKKVTRAVLKRQAA